MHTLSTGFTIMKLTTLQTCPKHSTVNWICMWKVQYVKRDLEYAKCLKPVSLHVQCVCGAYFFLHAFIYTLSFFFAWLHTLNESNNIYCTQNLFCSGRVCFTSLRDEGLWFVISSSHGSRVFAVIWDCDRFLRIPHTTWRRWIHTLIQNSFTWINKCTHCITLSTT